MLSEPAATPVNEDTELEKRPIDNYELASRLSYFLWSSMPDDELFVLAAKGTLSDEDVLELVEMILGALGRGDRSHERLVGISDMAIDHVEMALVDRQVDRLAHRGR